LNNLQKKLAPVRDELVTSDEPPPVALENVLSFSPAPEVLS
jgi:hypothetical protein